MPEPMPADDPTPEPISAGGDAADIFREHTKAEERLYRDAIDRSERAMRDLGDRFERAMDRQTAALKPTMWDKAPLYALVVFALGGMMLAYDIDPEKAATPVPSVLGAAHDLATPAAPSATVAPATPPGGEE